MDIKTHEIDNHKIAEISAEEVLIAKLEDALDITGTLYYDGYDRVILYQKNLTPAFFDLKTKIAGDILQKFTQYQMSITIVGNFESYDSQSLA
ncbi:uncharacterized protein DUF4180, partial [Sphingobacterium alimentarium]